MTLIDRPPAHADARPATQRLLEALDARRPGHALPAALYTDPDLHELDLRFIWQRQWIFVGSVAEVPEAGDYLTVDLGPSSVLVLRDDDEQVRAFRNVCRHRGARLVEPGHGSVGNLVCGYHRWTYGTDGALRHAPQLMPGTDPACLGLRTVALREVAGLLFVCLAADPPDDLDRVAEVVDPYLAPHRLSSAKVAAQVDLVEDGNWKLTMENNRECYHCDGHPELLCSLFPTWGLAAHQVPERLRADHERYLQAERDLVARCEELGLPHALVDDLVHRSVGFRVQREPLDGAGESFSPDGRALVRRLLGDLPEFRLGRLGLHTQPNAWFHLQADHAITFAALPLSVDRTLVRTTWLVDADAEEGVDYDVEELTATWRATNAQDADFVALTQAGVADPGYEPGPYSEAEGQVEAFVSWYADRMREEVAR
ncbi:aromatic ring-hydroxylating oxygenase subunit alpha [Nocardioides bruguierae]|uniref:Aromatic ring-hydroxylating dioxygenase subunit alpha n=1 Tax=Nocardioides bruguierae TaxID=2945102 RepID=A0A9X2ICV5_9ACTN|nr:aromatic ring-hydroxylating dioxygenase subunit alpha [Nocardioides bruguierae]MCM0619101.1 aromatic ring-hydroxylating dioxygenase subunit alpha [Nocardioides bruguierae]